ncbi:MAG: anaerobic sulfatase maturase [Clostridia bacterium]|nr:anaerobic sulfatase maturase [Clostridia bacterium]
MNAVSFLIKPASSLCNLRCRYCFYHSIAESRLVSSYGLMKDETLESIVKKGLECAQGSCTFAFQGGEPTLAGLDFYRNLIHLVSKYNARKIKINYALQTNGMAIDNRWADFLSSNGFLVGVSLDGPKEIHDEMRVDHGFKGSFNRVMRAAGLFNRHGVDYNILCVVNSNVARHVKKVYNFFKKNGFRYLQFIPCLDPLGQAPGAYAHSLTPRRYADSLKGLFDEWYNDILKGDMVSIRYFDNLMGMILGYPPESCGMSGVCSSYFTIEADGGVYPCDFYVTDEWYMGNINEMDLESLKLSEAANRFSMVSRHIDPMCRECRWFNLCRGGCRRDREPFIDGVPGLNYFCSSFKEFFEYSANRLASAARLISGN